MNNVKKHLKDKLKFWEKTLKNNKKEVKEYEKRLKKACEACATRRCVGHKNKDVKEAQQQVEGYIKLIKESENK